MDRKDIFDVIIIGGGVSGCSCAWNCAKLGLKTLLVEKKSYLGGAISGGLVVPMMKTDDKEINIDFYNELIKYMKLYDGQITYADMNKGWFNPELIKIALDDMLTSAGVKILFNSDIYDITTTVNEPAAQRLKEVLTYNNKTIAQTYNDKILKSILLKRNILSYYDYSIYSDNKTLFKNEKHNFKRLFKKISAKYFVDASGDAIISELLNLRMQSDNKLKQAETLRFIMANVDTKAFSEWLLKADNDRTVTNVISGINGEFYMTTAYTWDKDKKWALRPIFKTAVENGDLEEEDTAYFQIFGVAKMPGAIAFNCPRVNQDLPNEEKLINARRAIFRIANFCKLYLTGFEKAYISHIAEDLGVRVSNRPLALYNYSVKDISAQNTFDNVALHSNYPIDIHSNKKNKSVLDLTKGYDFPLESMMSADYRNLFNIGKAIGADFKSQAALRVQKSCLSMGEAVAKYIKTLD